MKLSRQDKQVGIACLVVIAFGIALHIGNIRANKNSAVVPEGHIGLVIDTSDTECTKDRGLQSADGCLLHEALKPGKHRVSSQSIVKLMDMRPKVIIHALTPEQSAIVHTCGNSPELRAMVEKIGKEYDVNLCGPTITSD